MKKILITGALGFLGSRLIPYMKDRGYVCRGFDTGFFQDCLLFPGNDQDVVLGDMRNFPLGLLEGIDAVIHLASISNDSFGNLDAARIYEPTRRYTLELAKRCKERGIKFIFPSSCSIYGVGKTGELVDEQGPCHPLTSYSSTKLDVERDLSGIADKNFSPIVLRLATVYGVSPRIRFDVVVNMLTAMAFVNNKIILNSDGQAWRPHVHIDDVCEAFCRSVELDYTQGEPLIINIGDSAQNFRILDVAQMVAAQVNGCEIVFLKQLSKQLSEQDVELIKDRKLQDGVDRRTYKISFEKAKQVFKGFQCRWTVPQGIHQMLEEFQRLGLDESTFKSFKFYRLQKIEQLHKAKLINDELYWTVKV